MLYLDTGCLLKLYHPEPNSPAVAAAVRGEELCFHAFHQLELTCALQAKVFRRLAGDLQMNAVQHAVDEDIAMGKLRRVECPWLEAFTHARGLAARHGSTIGSRTLDTLHCAIADLLQLELISADARQVALARAAGISVRAL